MSIFCTICTEFKEICYNTDMKSIATVVEHIVQESPFLKELVSLDVVNLSGLARQIKSAVEEATHKEVSEGSILVALKRLTKKIQTDNQLSSTFFTMHPEITVRSNLFEVTVKNSPTFIDKQKKLLLFANRQQSHFLTFTFGPFETTTVGSNQILDMTMSLYAGEQVVSTIENVAIISIKFPTSIVDSPFLYYSILRTLAWSGISIVEMISTYSELVLVLNQQDIELAFSLIRKLFTAPTK